MARKKPTPGKSSYVAGQGTGPEVAASLATKKNPEEITGKERVLLRSQEWMEHRVKWMRQRDSYEGGDRYRNATYGPDRKGLPTRNLFRHRREYPDPQQFPYIYDGFAGNAGNLGSSSMALAYGPNPGSIGADPGTTAQDDEYELRRARTPVPEFVAECVEIHLGKIYEQEVHRDGPAILIEWWEDVDGCGSSIDDYMKEQIAPLLLVCGCLDVVCDHPRLPQGIDQPKTKADEELLGLNKCVASYILPENNAWWIVDYAKNYQELLIREWIDDGRVQRAKDDKSRRTQGLGDQYQQAYEHWRHWTKDWWILYNYDGSEIVAEGPNPYGLIPIQRLVDKPLHRQQMVGKSRYEAIAVLQREYYNKDSELILSDTIQAHPQLSGPEDYCKADNTVSVGPGNILPKKKNTENGTYEGWEFVSPPKDPAESLRQNKQDMVELKDRYACLTKPAGAQGRTGGSVGQSGISKSLDAVQGDKFLTAVAKTLAKAERQIAERAYVCLTGQPITPEIRKSISIVYPQKFNLFSADEIADGLVKIQGIASMVGALPLVETALLDQIIRSLATGLPDADYEAFRTEIEELLATKAQIKEAHGELQLAGIQSAAEAMDGAGTEASEAEENPTGQSGATQIGNAMPAMV